MKGIGKILIGIAAMTILLVFYVHEQIALFQISYILDKQAEAFETRSETYWKLKFEVDQLKAPRLLEQRMNELKLDLTLPHEVRVVRMPAPPALVSAPVTRSVSGSPLTDGVLDLLGRWVDVAQAKTES